MNQPKSSSYSKTKRIPIYLTSTVLQLFETTPLYRVAKKPSKSAKAKERRQKRKNHSEVLQKTESCRDWSKKRTATWRVPPTTNQRGTERERERERERKRERERERRYPHATRSPACERFPAETELLRLIQRNKQ